MTDSDKELRVAVKAEEFASYTIKICKNENNFPKKYRWCITNKIVEKTIDVGCMVIHANALRIDGKDQEKVKRNLLERIKLKEKALATLEEDNFCMDIAYRLFGADSINIEHWTGLKIELKKLIRAWNNSDIQKMKEVTGDGC